MSCTMRSGVGFRRKVKSALIGSSEIYLCDSSRLVDNF